LHDVLREVSIAGENDGVSEELGQSGSYELLEGHATTDAAAPLGVHFLLKNFVADPRRSHGCQGSLTNMSGGRWHDARKALARLSGWDDASAARHDVDPLEALCDIGSLRRLLDEAELSAVRVARRQKRSWAEIATMLGVTRQSAWERWRDLDEAPDAVRDDADGPAAQPTAAGAVATAASELTDWAKRRRRKGSVTVPRVIGLRTAGARGLIEEHGLVPVGWDLDGVPYENLGWPDQVVTGQVPEAGAKVAPGTSVRVWLATGGGGAGVREPRRPSPSPRSGREMRPEPSQSESTLRSPWSRVGGSAGDAPDSRRESLPTRRELVGAEGLAYPSVGAEHCAETRLEKRVKREDRQPEGD
jgi:hypothetical protein